MASRDNYSKKTPLYDRVGRLVVSGRFRRALDLIDGVIEDQMPLFEGEPWVIEERRLAWLYRIDLLREKNRLTEALAWACLEVEMNPDNVTAIALKERLKRQSGLLTGEKRRDNDERKNNEEE